MPDSIANQIAAGEVISRPASAVKELLENAIDSGATKIKLVVKDAGRTLIQVSDNGCGMNETDARLCFERHATSKIKSSDDLFNLHTKGFRGEALASIAAVAQVELKTKRTEDAIGTAVFIEGSEVTKQEPVSFGDGTTISMKNLFYNVPARRNFLKSDQVELKHIIEEFQRVALVHPEIEFSFTHNGDQIFNLPISGLRQRLVNFFGKSLNEKLVPIETETPLVSVQGFIFKPQFCKKVRGDQFFFVNNRFIKSPMLNHAVQNGYSQVIPSDHHAGFFIYLQVPTSSIDVNIHPTKTEVKFEHEKEIYTIVNAAVRQALGKHNMVPSIDFNRENEIEFSPVKSSGEIKIPTITVNPNYNPFKTDKQNDTPEFATQHFDDLRAGMISQFENAEENVSVQQKLYDDNHHVPVFKVFGKYLLASFEAKILVIHIRRAFERVSYEWLTANKSNISSQQLLFAEQVQLSPSKLALYMEVKEEIQQNGFDITYAGDNTLHVNGLPAVLEQDVRVAELLEQIIDDADKSNNGLGINVADIIHRKLAYSMSVQKALNNSNDHLQELVSDLMQTSMPTHTPGGLLVFYAMSKDELERRFN